MKQFLRFALVGAVGFVTDFGVLSLALSVLGLNPLAGRLLSFLFAATVTWKANRKFTFAQQGAGTTRQWLQYLLATSIGGGINITVYQFWLMATDTSSGNLFLGVAVGSAAAMVFNFGISKRVVFTA